MDKRLWITWEVQRRNRTLSNKLNATLLELIGPKHRAIKYPVLLIRTFKQLVIRKPKILFVQNPSIVLSFFAVIIKSFLKIETLVVDCHNGGLFPLEGRSKILNYLAKFIVKKADMTLVTNKELSKYVALCGGRSLIVTDPLPEIKASVKGNSGEKTIIDRVPNAVFICTWSLDEPYHEVVSAADKVQDKVKIYITGNSKGKLTSDQIPSNVILTGFLEEGEYEQLIASVDFILVLTKRDNCLNCGAYEAVSLAKPLILSDSEALQSYFSTGTIFTNNTVDSIETCINEMLLSLPDKEEEVKTLKQKLLQEWPACQIELESFLE